jgi:hypothetical protein
MCGKCGLLDEQKCCKGLTCCCLECQQMNGCKEVCEDVVKGDTNKTEDCRFWITEEERQYVQLVRW